MIQEIPQLKAPNYHRQRLILFFLEAAGERLSKLDFQKLLFLYHQDYGVNHYAFVPYRFGCFSFLCKDDLELMEKRGWVASDGNQLRLNQTIASQSWASGNSERREVRRWFYRNTERGNELIRETYRKFPYYAVNSEIKERLLTPDELLKVEASIPKPKCRDAVVVFTLGYEGIHFETYVNKLIQNRISVLCDVRKNPLSRKFGFSSKMLGAILPKFGIEYVHFPELGIESDKRQELDSMDDYERLFSSYRQDLPKRTEGLIQLNNVIQKHKRVALTCFEAEPHCCHRHCISDLLESQKGYTVLHL